MGNIFIFQWPLTQLSFLKCFFIIIIICKNVGNRSRRKQLVNHCPLSHRAHDELEGLGTHWVVAVLTDSCRAQCLKLSSNVWHMVCVSLWPVTLMPLLQRQLIGSVADGGPGVGQSVSLQRGNNSVSHSVTKWLTTNLLRSPLQYLTLASSPSGNVLLLPAHVK